MDKSYAIVFNHLIVSLVCCSTRSIQSVSSIFLAHSAIVLARRAVFHRALSCFYRRCFNNIAASLRPTSIAILLEFFFSTHASLSPNASFLLSLSITFRSPCIHRNSRSIAFVYPEASSHRSIKICALLIPGMIPSPASGATQPIASPTPQISCSAPSATNGCEALRPCKAYRAGTRADYLPSGCIIPHPAKLFQYGMRVRNGAATANMIFVTREGKTPSVSDPAQFDPILKRPVRAHSKLRAWQDEIILG